MIIDAADLLVNLYYIGFWLAVKILDRLWLWWLGEAEFLGQRPKNSVRGRLRPPTPPPDLTVCGPLLPLRRVGLDQSLSVGGEY